MTDDNAKQMYSLMSRQNIIEVNTMTDLRDVITSNVTVVVGITTPDTNSDLKIFIRKFLKRRSEQFHLIKFVYMDVSDKLRGSLNILSGNDDDFPKIIHIRDGNCILAMVTGATPELILENFKEVESVYTKEMKEVEEYMKKNKTIQSEESEKSEESKESKEDEIPLQKDSQKKSKTSTNTTNTVSINASKNVDQSKNNITMQSQPMILSPEVEKKIKLEKLIFLTKRSDDIKIEMVKEVALRKRLEMDVQKTKDQENETKNKETKRAQRKR
jgi:hypothetical protein